MTVGSVIHNLVFAFIGNYIGGGLVMGLGYAWLNNSKSTYFIFNNVRKLAVVSAIFLLPEAFFSQTNIGIVANNQMI